MVSVRNRAALDVSRQFVRSRCLFQAGHLKCTILQAAAANPGILFFKLQGQLKIKLPGSLPAGWMKEVAAFKLHFLAAENQDSVQPDFQDYFPIARYQRELGVPKADLDDGVPAGQANFTDWSRPNSALLVGASLCSLGSKTWFLV
jgi:hypothetical protein